MSVIARLSISRIRNIESASVEPSESVNVFWGENGSGKTSILEAIHLLATGKSFRSSKTDTLISHEHSEAVVFAELSDSSQIGLSRVRKQSTTLKLQNEKQRNWDSVARAVPIQILDSSSFQLLEGGPKARRKFLDWGVFHVEQSFLDNWRKASKCIANRNLLLKQRRPDLSQLEAWSSELVLAADQVDVSRRRYFDQFLPLLTETYGSLDGVFPEDLQIQYDRGWSDDAGLDLVLGSTLEADLRYGSTQNGPHRADLKVRVGNSAAIEVLSRGQQKILVSALKIAQGRYMSRTLGRQCMYLVDDLPSELDATNRAAVLDRMSELGGQLFITSVDLEPILVALKGAEIATFHVERGTIRA